MSVHGEETNQQETEQYCEECGLPTDQCECEQEYDDGYAELCQRERDEEEAEGE